MLHFQPRACGFYLALLSFSLSSIRLFHATHGLFERRLDLNVFGDAII